MSPNAGGAEAKSSSDVDERQASFVETDGLVDLRLGHRLLHDRDTSGFEVLRHDGPVQPKLAPELDCPLTRLEQSDQVVDFIRT